MKTTLLKNLRKQGVLALLILLAVALPWKAEAQNTLLSQNFDSFSSISTSYSSTGWYAYNAGSGNNWTLNTSSNHANSGNNSAQVKYHSSNAANCYLVSTPFTVNADMTNLSVSLYEKVRIYNNGTSEAFEVFFVKASDVTTDASVTSATKYNAIASNTYTNDSYAQVSGSSTNSALKGQSVRVVIHCTSIADQYYLLIDDITVTETTSGGSGGSGGGTTIWAETTTITPNQEYLIGLVNGSSVYLVLNYSPNTTNHYYYSSSSNWWGYTALATIDGDGYVTGCTGNATDLQYAQWKFSSSSGGTITSNYESTRYLYGSTSYTDLYPNTSSTTWSYSNNMLSYNSGSYYMYLNTSGNYVQRNSSGTTVKLYTKATLYNITLTQPAGGTISASVAGGTPTTSSTTAQAGQTVTLTATASAGYTFDSWSVSGVTGTASSSGNTYTYTFEMPSGNVSASANFTASGSSSDIYVRVTSSQTDWSGTYILGAPANDGEGGVYPFTGDIRDNSDDYAYGYSTGTTSSSLLTETDNIISDPGYAAILTIGQYTYNSSTYYTILTDDNLYFGSSSSGLSTTSTLPTGTGITPYLWTFSYDSGNNAVIMYSRSTNSSTYYVRLFAEDYGGSSLYHGFCDHSTLTISGSSFTYSYATLYKKVNCTKTIPYTYGFEDATDFGCWSTEDCEENDGYSGITTRYPRTGSNSFSFSSYKGETDPQYLISPELSGLTNALHVEFFYRNWDAAPETFQVGYSTTTNDVSSFTWGSTITNIAQTYQRFSNYYPASTKYIAVKYTTADSYYLILDDFTFEEAPSCYEPNTVVASNETTTGATIGWTAGGSESAWDLYYTDNSSDVPTSSTTPSISGINTNSRNLTSLTPATTYYVYVRAACSGSDKSHWSNPCIFNTECEGMSLPYSETFESGALTVCWNIISDSPVYMDAEVSSSNYFAGSYCLDLRRGTPSGNQIIVLPEVASSYLLKNYEVSFYAKLYAGSGNNATATNRQLAVGIMTAPDDASTFVQVGDAVTPTSSYAQYTFGLSSYTGSGHYIAIMHTSTSTSNGHTCIDNLEVIANNYTLTPTVNPSVGGTISANGTVITSATSYSPGTSVSLTATPATGYNFTSWGGDLSGSTNPTSITMNADHSVTANFALINYTITTSASNGSIFVASTANYNESVSFTVSPNSGYTLSNVAVTKTASGDAISCTESSGTYSFTMPAEAATITATFEASSCPVVVFSEQGYTNEQVITSVTIGSDVSVTFSQGTNSDYAPKYHTSGTAIRVYAGNTFTISSSPAATIESINFSFGSSDGDASISANTGTYAGGTWTGSASSVTFTVGSGTNRRIAGIEVCTASVACPAPTMQPVSGITANSATISWTGSDAGSFNVRYREMDTIFFEGFESGIPNTPNTWTKIDADGDGNNWLALSDISTTYSAYNSIDMSSWAHGGSDAACSPSYFNDPSKGSLNSNNWLITPQLTLNGIVKFYASSTYSDHDSYEVLLSTSGTAIDDFNITLQAMKEAPSDGEDQAWEEVVIDLDSYAGQQGYIAIHHVSSGMYFLVVDDFGLYGGAWQTPSSSPVSASNITLTDLDAETTYQVQVQANCGSTDGLSAWSDIATFTTPGECDVPFNLLASEVLAKSATLTWDGGQESYNVRYREAGEKLEEGFEDGSIPEGWSKSGAWSIGQGAGTITLSSTYEGLYNAKYTSASNTSSEYYLIMPAMDFSGASNLSLSLYYANPYYSPSYEDDIDGFGVYYRVNEGAWNELFYTTEKHNTWTSLTVPLTGFAANYQIGFKVSDSWGGGVAIDNVSLTLTQPGDWVNNTNVTSPLNITGLESGTTYEWQVQGVNSNCSGGGTGLTDWSETATFTTDDNPNQLWTNVVTSQPVGYTESYDDEEDVYNITISTNKGLAWLIKKVNGFIPLYSLDPSTPKNVTITADIDMSDYIWVPIGDETAYYSGTFDGQYHAIKGIHIANASEISAIESDASSIDLQYTGFFGYTDEATIKNTFVLGGQLACSVSGGYLGGLVGYANNSTIEMCESSNTLTAIGNNIYVGGIAGKATGNVNAVMAMGNIIINGTGAHAGGITGEGGTVKTFITNHTISGTGASVATKNKLNTTNGYCITSNGDYDMGTEVSGAPSYNYGQCDNSLIETLNATSAPAANFKWILPKGSNINGGGYPIIARTTNDGIAVVNETTDGKVLRYGEINTLLGTAAYQTTDHSVFMYNNGNISVDVPANSLKLYIDENVAMTQVKSSGSGSKDGEVEYATVNATVGVTIDNSTSSSNGLTRDWHMFSSAIKKGYLGIKYVNQTHDLNNGNVIELSYATSGQDAYYLEEGDTVYFPNGIHSYADGDPGLQFDLYSFFEPQYHWINLKRDGQNHWHNDGSHAQINYNGGGSDYSNEKFFTPGKGYLVALGNKTTATNNFMQAKGVLNNGDVDVSVTTDGAHLTGYNLLGNPYQSYLDFTVFTNVNSDIWAEASTKKGYIIYDDDQGGFICYGSGLKDIQPSIGSVTATRYLHPHQGFLVIADNDGHVTFTNAMRETDASVYGPSNFRSEQPAYPVVNLFCTDSEGKKEIAVVEIERPETAGVCKPKDMLNGNGQMYTHWDNSDYGLLFIDHTPEYVPVWFKSTEEGVFTMSWNTANDNFGYLHLIDNLTGNDIDMLAADSYVFQSKPSDSKARFRLVFKPLGIDEETTSEQGENFAFINGNELVVTGEGELSLIDLNGRVLTTEYVSGQQSHITMPKVAVGMYMLRLSNSDGVKVQKIVVRK